MAGHNKWSKVKRLKAVTDSRRGKVFSRLSRDITMAAKSGGGDPGGNARLRTLLLKAREANMPVENVDRAIKKGTGELPGVVFEELVYEGYGPGGVAFVVEVTTDNKTRAAKEVRAIFASHGGNLAQTGAVAFQFLHAGQFLLAPDKVTEDRLMDLALEAGANDVITTAQGHENRPASSPIVPRSPTSPRPPFRSPAWIPPGRCSSSTRPSTKTRTCRRFFPTKRCPTRSAPPPRPEPQAGGVKCAACRLSDFSRLPHTSSHSRGMVGSEIL